MRGGQGEGGRRRRRKEKGMKIASNMESSFCEKNELNEITLRLGKLFI